MFAGKTTSLLGAIKYYKSTFKKKKILVFKPAIDQRLKKINECIINHDLSNHPAIMITDNQIILECIDKHSPDIVFFDEINLFSEGFSQIVKKVLEKGIKVICAGLSKDFQNNYFPEISNFLELKPKIKKLFANCYKCFAKASNSQRLIDRQEVILVGNGSTYAPACDTCFNPLLHQQKKQKSKVSSSVSKTL